MTGYLVVLCTVGQAEDADLLARELVERQLAACVNIVPGITSVYRFEGKLERDEERLLVIKTRADRFEALREAILALHPYQLPEIVALEIAAGHVPYLAWIGDSVG